MKFAYKFIPERIENFKKHRIYNIDRMMQFYTLHIEHFMHKLIQKQLLPMF